MNSQIGTCALCGEHKPLVESHIIPESCYKSFYDDKHRLIVLEGSLTKRPKRPPQKGFRERLLCANCDNDRLGLLDKYFAEEWIGRDRLSGWMIPGTSIRAVTNLDYHQFKLFHLSVLFRAHVSTLQEFSEVKLRPNFVDKLRQILISGAQSGGAIPDSFMPIAAFAYLDQRGKGFLGWPECHTVDGFRVFSLYYGDCRWIFLEMDTQVSASILPSWLDALFKLRLQASGRMLIHCEDWLNSKPMREVLRQV